MPLGKLAHVNAEKIRDDEYQMRDVGDDKSFRELVASVLSVGILTPILLKQKEEIFLVVAGHRRFKAALMAGLSEVPAYIFSDGSNIGWNAAFAENLYRKDLSPIEEAAAIKDCLETGGLDITSLSAALGRSEAWVIDRLSFLDWPDDLTLAVHLGKMSISAARNLALINDTPHRSMLIGYAVDNGSTARTTAAWLQSWRAGMDVSDPGEIPQEAGTPGLPPIEPYTPCIICGDKRKMIELTYAPVCRDCTGTISMLAAEVRQRSGADPVVVV